MKDVLSHADRTIGEHESMDFEAATNWFNQRGCRTNAKVLNYHALKGNFHMFCLNGKQRMSIVEAERILVLDPKWLHIAEKVGKLTGFIPMAEAARTHKVPRSLIREWIDKCKIRSYDQSTTGEEDLMVSSQDVDTQAMLYARLQARIALHERSLNHPTRRETAMAKKKSMSPHEVATQYGFKYLQLKTVLQRDILPAESSKPGSKGNRYTINEAEMAAVLEGIPELLSYLEGNGRIDDIMPAINAYRAKHGQEPLPLFGTEPKAEAPESVADHGAPVPPGPAAEKAPKPAGKPKAEAPVAQHVPTAAEVDAMISQAFRITAVVKRFRKEVKVGQELTDAVRAIMTTI